MSADSLEELIQEVEVPLEEATCDDGEQPETFEELDIALDRFKDAAREMLSAWEAAQSDDFDETQVIEGYPEFMPSFDEFVIEVLGMQIRERVAE